MPLRTKLPQLENREKALGRGALAACIVGTVALLLDRDLIAAVMIVVAVFLLRRLLVYNQRP
jgi:hypothetical protein